VKTKTLFFIAQMADC